MPYPNVLDTTTVTIANGQSLSGAADLKGLGTPVRIDMPAAWTAANLTFQVSADGVTYQDLYDDGGSEVTVTAAAGRSIFLQPAEWAHVRYLKVRSGTAAVPVNQGTDRLLTLVVRPV
jgi:hypothetical protein